MSPQSFHPKISIVIPVYNGSNYLCEAVDSALAQTYTNIEILVVNDGSRDNSATRAIAHSYGERIRYFEKVNGGVASALNYGIRHMTGDFFSWLSHDDVYYPHKIKTQVEFLQRLEDREVILYSNFDLIDKHSCCTRTIVTGGFKPDQFRIALVLTCPLHGCDALIPKSCFDQIGLFDESLVTTNDYDMWFRLACKFNYIHIPESLIQGRVHAESDSVVKKHLALKEINSRNISMLDTLPMMMVQDYSNGHLGLFYLECAFSFAFRQACASCFYAVKKSLKYIYSDEIAHIAKYHLLLCYLLIKLIYVFMILASYRLRKYIKL